MQQRYLLVSILIGGTSFPAFAQDAGSLLSDKLRFDSVPEIPPLPLVIMEDEPLSLPVEGAFTPTVQIKSLRFNGNISLLTEAQRSELASGVAGTDVGMAGIRALTEAANSRLWQNGFLLARAIIPPQDTTNGVLTVSIFDAPLDDIAFKFDKSVRTNHEIFPATAERYIDRERFNKNDLDTALRRINELPAVNARSRLAQGKLAGTTKIIVDVSQDPLLTGSLDIDNFGHPSTGRLQADTQIQLADITGNGDLTRLGVTVSKGQRYASAAIITPVSSRELLATFDYGYLHYDNIDQIDGVATLRGNAHYAAIGLTKRAIRSRHKNVTFSAMLNGKVLRDVSTIGQSAKKRAVSGVLGITGEISDTFGGGGVNVFSGSWTIGKLNLSQRPSAVTLGEHAIATPGKFHRLNAQVARLQKLPDNFSLYAGLSGQWAKKRLDSSESFSLSGPNGVRGFAAGEARGDKGILGRAELHYDAPHRLIAGNVRISGFVDAGRVWENNNNSFGIPTANERKGNNYSIASAGMNVSFRHKNFGMSVGWSQGFAKNARRSGFNGTEPDGRTGRQKLGISASIRF